MTKKHNNCCKFSIQAKVIFENIKTELIGSIDALSDTLSAPFSKQLKDRVTHLHEKIGYPDWVLNQTQVNLYYNTMVR